VERKVSLRGGKEPDLLLFPALTGEEVADGESGLLDGVVHAFATPPMLVAYQGAGRSVADRVHVESNVRWSSMNPEQRPHVVRGSTSLRCAARRVQRERRLNCGIADIRVEHFDVLIVGAGLSGIGAGCRLLEQCPDKRFAILESRGTLGGTWDLFRFPGVRSDSDMYTLSYPFRPWKGAKAIADGPSILRYVRETAQEYGIERRIRYQHRVRAAQWSSQKSGWTIDCDLGDGLEPVRLSCRFLYLCTGYYSYENGYLPEYPGGDAFKGWLIHPQQWPVGLDYRGKRVVIIGSGATAITLVPAMSEHAAHVTMLQRSPGYVVAIPSRDQLANTLRQILPEGAAHRLARMKNIVIAMGFYQLLRRAPEFSKRLLRLGVAKFLPQGYEIDKHFKPRYQPWDQRVCFAPSADFFKALSSGRASIITDRIEQLTETGIRLASGCVIDADLIVSATGLRMKACGGIHFKVDGQAVDLANSFVHKGVMLSGLPNAAICVGYANASWTLRADLVSNYVCRLLRHMDRNGYTQVEARCDGVRLEPSPLLPLTSGYVQRSAAEMPKQGGRYPWRLPHNYFIDLFTLRWRSIADRHLRFARDCA
jgi:monooxygenase